MRATLHIIGSAFLLAAFVMSSNNREISVKFSIDYLTIPWMMSPVRRRTLCAIRAIRGCRYQTDRLVCACRVVPRFGRARKQRSWSASSVPPIGSFLISDLAGPTSEVIRLVHIRMILPELLRRVGAFDAHAAHHAHFGTIRLSLGAVSDRQRHAGVVIDRIETGDQIESNETVHVTRSPRCARSRSGRWRVARRSVIAATSWVAGCRQRYSESRDSCRG